MKQAEGAAQAPGMGPVSVRNWDLSTLEGTPPPAPPGAQAKPPGVHRRGRRVERVRSPGRRTSVPEAFCRDLLLANAESLDPAASRAEVITLDRRRGQQGDPEALVSGPVSVLEMVRVPHSHPRARHRVGYTVFDSLDGPITLATESVAEMRALRHFEWHPDFYPLLTQPVLLAFPTTAGGPVLRHFPDLLLSDAVGRRLLVDVRPHRSWCIRFALACVLTARLCSLLGMGYLVVSELPPGRIKNLDALAVWRHPTRAVRRSAARIRETVDPQGESLGRVIDREGGITTGGGPLLHALACADLDVDLNSLLTRTSIVARRPPMPRDGGFVVPADAVASSVLATVPTRRVPANVSQAVPHVEELR